MADLYCQKLPNVLAGGRAQRIRKDVGDSDLFL